MKRILKLFVFIPFIKRLYYRKYYGTGLGTYLINSFFKRIMGFGRGGDFLLHFTSRINSPKNLKILNHKNSSTVYLSLATSGGCYYQAINGIEFGGGTIWANNCSFIITLSRLRINTVLISGSVSLEKLIGWFMQNDHLQ